jgi:isochorismate pyruvate lyase
MEKGGRHVNPRQADFPGLVPLPMNPESYTTMAQVRAGVDELDRQLVALFDQRFAHMRAAARIKPDRGAVRDEARKAEVIENARAEAERLGAPANVIAALWEQLVEASIAYEMTEFDRLRTG